MKGVKYISLAETTGYGQSAVAYIRALLGVGIPVTWQPMIMTRNGYEPATDAEQAVAGLASLPNLDDLRAAFHARIDYEVVVVHTMPEYWPAALESGKRMIGYSVWETDRLPLHWPALLAGYDMILTPSTFSRDVFAPRTDITVAVLPHLPRTDWPAGDAASLAAFRKRFGIEEHELVFYTINSWILRKAMWLALHGFLLTFTADEPVVFFVKTSQEGEMEGQPWGPVLDWFDGVLSNYVNPARIVLAPDELAYEDIGLLHLTGDVFVSLTRCEGFGMGAYDAATAGTPVIITGWGGQLDFLPAEHACLIDYELRRVKGHLGNHPSQEQYWAHADLDHAIEWMRHLYKTPSEARSRGRALKSHIADRFDPADITARLVALLKG